MNGYQTIIYTGIILAFCCCSKPQGEKVPADPGWPVFENSQQERDYIYMMMAYAVAYKDWQYIDDVKSARGYNIGAVIIDESNDVISWGRNEKFARRNGTQHAEVRAMQSFLDHADDWFLEDCTLYTTLEPCVMCAGMMVMSRIERVVFGQPDPHYGGAMERMKFTSSTHEHNDTIKSYPRKLIYERSSDHISAALDSLYRTQRSKGTTKFLSTPTAEIYFEQATRTFLTHQAQFKENTKYLDRARVVYGGIPGTR